MSRKDVFEVQEKFEVFMSLIVPDDAECDHVCLLLLFGSTVSGHETQAYILSEGMGTSPCMPTKLLFLSFYSSISAAYFCKLISR